MPRREGKRMMCVLKYHLSCGNLMELFDFIEEIGDIGSLNNVLSVWS